jgi:translation initiation factor IF-3
LLAGVPIEPNLRKNHEIRARELILIDETGKNLGRVTLEQALIIAQQRGFDLVEVGPHATPPVAKLLDWGKYKYQLAKKERRAKVRGGGLKEVKLSLKIGRHDFETKVKRAREFLEEGNKVGVFLQLVGREQMFQDKARELLHRFKDMVGGEFEEPIDRVGNRLTGIIVRRK